MPLALIGGPPVASVRLVQPIEEQELALQDVRVPVAVLLQLASQVLLALPLVRQGLRLFSQTKSLCLLAVSLLLQGCCPA